VTEPRTTRTAFRGAFVQVEIEDWPELGEWEIVRRHDATAVLPVTPGDSVLLNHPDLHEVKDYEMAWFRLGFGLAFQHLVNAPLIKPGTP
jgi:hypothetical protein